MSNVSVRVYTGEVFRMWDNDVMDSAVTVSMTAEEFSAVKSEFTKTTKADAEMCIMSGKVNSAGAFIGHPKMFWGK